MTFGNTPQLEVSKREIGTRLEVETNINHPPYAIHNGEIVNVNYLLRCELIRPLGNGDLSTHTLATNATHAGGIIELDVHNLWGLMEEKATHLALNALHPEKRPFIISRSTFPSSGKWTGHWLGDNMSKWQYMYFNIQGALQFQLFQIPFVGADTCGFMGNTDEELCNRWMQLSAFMPFFRNHNQRGALSQEPFRWDSVASASKIAIQARYSLLPYWVSSPFCDANTPFSNRKFIVHVICERIHVWVPTHPATLLRVPNRARTVWDRPTVSHRERYPRHPCAFP